MIAALALATGLLTGLASGGDVRRLASLDLRHESVILVGFVLQGVARGRILGTSATPWGSIAWEIITPALAILLLLNYRVPGALVAAVGLLLNVDVVLANGAMPVSVSGALVTPGEVISRSAGFYQLAGQGTLLAFMGDVIPLQVLGQRLFLSIGDVVMAVGVIALVCGAMASRVGSASPRPILDSSSQVV